MQLSLTLFLRFTLVVIIIIIKIVAIVIIVITALAPPRYTLFFFTIFTFCSLTGTTQNYASFIL